MNRLHSSNDRRNDRPRDLVNDVAEACVFLRWPTDDSERPNRAVAVIHLFDTQHREIVGQAVIAEVIAKRPFRFNAVRIDGANNAEVSICSNRQRSMLPSHSHSPSAQCPGKSQFTHSFRQRHHRCQRHRGRTTNKDVDSKWFTAPDCRRVMNADAAVNLVVQADLLIAFVLATRKLHAVHPQIGMCPAGSIGVF